MSELTIPLPPEYENNAFAAVVGPLRSFAQQHDAMCVLPAFSRKDREQHFAYRRACCLRLLDAYFPMTRQLLLAERIQLLIRDGYRHRDPNDGGHQGFLQEAIERLDSGDEEYVSRRALDRVASSSALLGVPGTGKTRTVRLALRSFPATAKHVTAGGFLTQVTALTVECPADRGVKQLCKNFFAALDDAIGWRRYSKKFGHDRVGAETMLLHVQHLCHLHAVGVLVIDEIQNLLDAPAQDKNSLMRFIVLLINTVGIPVLLVGTAAASEIFHAGLHAGRRGDGFGSDIWDRMSDDAQWNAWLEKLWRYQWTAIDTPLDADLASAMYEQCQGVPDLAVKLFMLVQMELMVAAETSRVPFPEIITRDVIEKVAASRFRMVAPMIAAMRANDTEALRRYRDISGFQISMDDVFAGLAGLSSDEYYRRRAKERAEEKFADEKKSFPELRGELVSLGFKQDLIDRIICQAEAEVPSGSMFAMVDVVKRLASEASARAEKKPRSTPRPRPVRAEVTDPDDVRNRGDTDADAEAAGVPAAE
ncbi:ATP-binding protein [Sphingomonas sp. TF3]|uniref:ATP-binding protein n=1 Tax=Sphingomonas sp. TF3 TaxID=2495580 RepID=UPI00163CE12E|nr:ATP-binding protein [Sphingomonas sp. TF3]